MHGAFCTDCGQRAVPPDPTVRELAGDAWQELSGYDGRIMATLRGLWRPGFLTREYVAGRRASYLPPVRLYLIVSVLYFLVAASVPESVSNRDGNANVGPGVTITQGGGRSDLTEQDRDELLASVEQAPWFIRPMIRSVAMDPSGFRTRMFTIMPRVFFAMLPVFAGLVALFYRGRHFPTALVFATHLHAFAFVVFTFSEAAKFTSSDAIADTVGGIAAVVFSLYAVRAFRAVFGGRWPITIAKATAIGFLYLLSAIPAIFLVVLWASWT